MAPTREPARDAELMALAVRAGEEGRRTAPPNPWVGCVLVDARGEIVATGSHERPGAPHAEANALAVAGERARGATAYVTLEPCSHQGRTAPCVDALIAAGISHVVVAVEDPDPRVAATGIARLREGGIRVVVDDCGSDARRSLAPYLHQRSTGHAYAVLKTAISLDGRTAAADGSSRWITGAEARADAHRLRAESQAVMVGAGTALADRPALTVRDVDGAIAEPPLRVLLDGSGRVPAEGPLFDVSLAPTLVYTTDSAASERVDAWRAAGAKVASVPGAPAGVNLDSVLAGLHAHGVIQVLVEGGPTVHASFVRAGLASLLVAYVAGVMLGPDATPMLAAPVANSLAAAPRWQLERVERLGGDVRLDYAPVPEGG